MQIRRAIEWFRRFKRDKKTPKEIYRSHLATAEEILNFVGTPGWEKYQSYLYSRLGRALDSAFEALDKNDDKSVIVALSRAQSYYELLRDVDRSVETIQQERERINKLTNA